MYERRIENSLYKMINKFKRYQLVQVIQEADILKQETAQAIPKACGFEDATRYLPAKKKGDLK